LTLIVTALPSLSSVLNSLSTSRSPCTGFSVSLGSKVTNLPPLDTTNGSNFQVLLPSAVGRSSTGMPNSLPRINLPGLPSPSSFTSQEALQKFGSPAASAAALLAFCR